MSCNKIVCLTTSLGHSFIHDLETRFVSFSSRAQYFIYTLPTHRTAHTKAFDIPVVSRWLGRFLSRTEEPAKAGTCARDRHALRQLALNVHVKHSDLT